MTERPGLNQSIRNKIDADVAARAEKNAPASAEVRAQLAADAKLYGTAGWNALSPDRQRLVAIHVREAQQQGADDAA